jgi:HK97 family phage portal protein
MAFFGDLKKRFAQRSLGSESITIGPTEQITAWRFNEAMGKINSFSDKRMENVSMVYSCVKILSETIARLPIMILREDPIVGKIKIKDDYRYKLLHHSPSSSINHYNFFSTLETHRNLKGNSYAYIHREFGKIKYFELIPPSRVYGYKFVEDELYYEISIKTKIHGEFERIRVHHTDLLHFKTITKDGVLGMNPIEGLRINLSTIWKGLSTIDNFYENNAATPKAIKMPLVNNKATEDAIKEFEKESSGPAGAGKIMRIPFGSEIVDLQLNFADAEFINTIKFNTEQIAAVYGIPPHLLGLMEHSKFNNVEQLQLNFKINTISPILRMYREELETKLLSDEEIEAGYSIEFNTAALVETDYKSKIDGLTKELSWGILTPNQAARIQGYEGGFEGGDYHYIQSGFIPIEKITNKWGESGENIDI